MKIHTSSLVIISAILGAALALIITLSFEPYCIGGGGGGFDATFVCSYK